MTTTAAPAPDVDLPASAPFTAHQHGVRAHGTVSHVGESYGTPKHVLVTVKHAGGHETTLTLPAHLAKRFPHGKPVGIHVMPRAAGTGVREPKAPAVDVDDEAGLSAASGDARGKAKPGDMIRAASKKGKRA